MAKAELRRKGGAFHAELLHHLKRWVEVGGIPFRLGLRRGNTVVDDLLLEVGRPPETRCEKVLPVVPGARNWSASICRPRPETAFGKAATTSGSMVEPSCGCVVLKAMEFAVTSTVSEAEPVESVTSMVDVTLTSIRMAIWTDFLNPAPSTVSE